MKYLVTAASGKLGLLAIDYLLKKTKPENVIALIRDPEKTELFKNKGIEVRIGDYTDHKSLIAGFSGVDKVLFISSNANPSTLSHPNFSRIDQHKTVIDALVKSEVKLVAYTSLVNAKDSKTFLAEDHSATEEILDESGLEYVSLRNNWYLENELPLLLNSAKGNVFSYSADQGRVGWALEREYAEAAANVLFVEKTKKIYELGGENSTYEDLAEALKEISNNTFDIKKVTEQEYKEQLILSGIPDNISQALASFQNDILNGVLDFPSNDLEILLNRRPTTLTEGIRELLSLNHNS